MGSRKLYYEWWAVDKDGVKHAGYVETKSNRYNKVLKQLQGIVEFNIDEAKDFGIRKINNPRPGM